jgi:hypothetical protein
MAKKLFIAVIVTAIVFATGACDKMNNDGFFHETTEITQTNEDKYRNMTLDEFIQSAETEDEINFFRNHNVIDNREIAMNIKDVYKSSTTAKNAMFVESAAKIKFRWGGTGCVNPIGGCIIIPIGKLVDNVTMKSASEEESNASIIISQGKCIITANTDDNGLTIDGYFPIYEDLYVDENTTIKAGIYTANYDAQLVKYTSVCVDTY